MLSTTEIRDIKFSRSVGGYKQEEVDVLLDRIEADYTQFERLTKEYEARIDALNRENQSLKASQSSIQNVLINAQKLADQIVQDAKTKSEEIVQSAQTNLSVITAKEKEFSSSFELKAKERKDALEKELAEKIKAAQIKADSIIAAAEDSVARQQMLYDKLKMEVAAFKAGISAKYKEHLEALRGLPDEVPSDPQTIAKLVSAAVSEAPKPEQYLPEAEPVQKQETAPQAPEIPAKQESGFVVRLESDETDESN